MESQVKTIGEIKYAELPEEGFWMREYVKLFNGTDYSLTDKFDGIYLVQNEFHSSKIPVRKFIS